MTEIVTHKRPDMGTDSIPKLIWTFALPAIIGLMINALYNVVDRIFVGNGVGALGLAGIAVSFPSFLVTFSFAVMIAVGGAVNFAIRLGQKKVALAEKILGNAVSMATLMAFILVTIQFVFLEETLTFFGATPSVMPYAKSYLGITLFGLIFLTANVVMNHFIRTSGYPKIAMYTMLIGAVANTILDPIFIFVFDMGIAGAAIATVISMFLSFLWAASFFISKRCPYRIRLKNLKLQSSIVFAIIGIGIAPFSVQIGGAFMQTVANKSLSLYGGDLAISAMGISTTIIIFLTMPVIGLCEGSQPLIGFNFGARNYKRVMDIFKISTFGAIALLALCWLFLRFYSQATISLFAPNDAEFIKVGSQALETITFLIPLAGIQISSVVFFQATKRPRIAMLLALSRQFLFLIPCLILLPKSFGLVGVFYAFPASDILSFILVTLVVFLNTRKRCV